MACLRSLGRSNIPISIATCGTGSSFVSHTRHARYIRNFVRYDSTDPESLVQSLRAIREVVGEFILFPSGEQILRWMVARKRDLAADGIVLPTVDLSTYEIVSDKQSFVELARRHGLPAPPERPGIPDRFDSKCVVKPIRGVWGRQDVLTSPVLIESEAALENLRRRSISPEHHFVQDYIEGPSFYYCGLYRRGEKLLSFEQRTLTQQPDGRAVVRAIPFPLPAEIVRKVDEMMSSLRWQGLMMMELKESRGSLYAIECNPRLWGPLQLAVDNGADFPCALWRLARGEDPQTVSPRPTATGYVWMSGYLGGWLIARRTGTRFQRSARGSARGIPFRELWFRRDTFLYGLCELMRAVWAIWLQWRTRSGRRSDREPLRAETG